MKNSNDTIGNRTHDLLACSAVPQPTAPPRTPHHLKPTTFCICRNVVLPNQPISLSTKLMENRIHTCYIAHPLQYTWSENSKLLKMIIGVLTSFSRCNPTWFPSMGLRQGSGLCSSSSRKYPGTEGTNQNRHWNHHRWHATNSLERTRLSCWCL